MRCALITGYPGHIARHLVSRLLSQDADTQLRLLTLEGTLGDARHALDALPADQRERCELWTGDVTRIDLGLSGPEVARAADELTDIFHLAAVTSPEAKDVVLERVNVGGTRNMLALATQLPNLKRVTYFSSAFVSGDRTGVVSESELDCGQSFRSAYELTKFRAECEVQRYMQRLPITVLRPGIVVGDSRSGRIDRIDNIYYLAVQLLASPVGQVLPLPLDGYAPLHLVPVDFVAATAEFLARDDDAAGVTFHLTDPNPLSVRQIYALLSDGSRRRTPAMSSRLAKLTHRVMRLPGIESRLREERTLLEQINQHVLYRTVNTLQHLDGTGLMCPPAERYIHKLVRYVRVALEKRDRARRGSDHDAFA